MLDVSACNDLKEELAAQQHQWRSHYSPLLTATFSPKRLSPIRRPGSVLCTCASGGGRAQLTACVLSSEQKRRACAGVIDDYGTTASGIILARAIYKQKHGLCLCHITILIPDPIRGGISQWLKCHTLLGEQSPTYWNGERNHISRMAGHNVSYQYPAIKWPEVLQTISGGHGEAKWVFCYQMHGGLMFRKIAHSQPHESNNIIDNKCHINKWWIAAWMWRNKQLSEGSSNEWLSPTRSLGNRGTAVLWGVKSQHTRACNP